MVKLSKNQQIALDAIRAEGPAKSIWISRNAGRVWMAGYTQLNSKATDKLVKLGLIVHRKTVDCPLEGQLEIAPNATEI